MKSRACIVCPPHSASLNSTAPEMELCRRLQDEEHHNKERLPKDLYQSDSPSSSLDTIFEIFFRNWTGIMQIRRKILGFASKGLLKMCRFRSRRVNLRISPFASTIDIFVRWNLVFYLVASVELVDDQPSHLTLDEDTRTQCWLVESHVLYYPWRKYRGGGNTVHVVFKYLSRSLQ